MVVSLPSGAKAIWLIRSLAPDTEILIYWVKETRMKMTIELDGEQARRLEELASSLGISTAILINAGVQEFLEQPDEDLEASAKRILEKNHELYKRLS